MIHKARAFAAAVCLALAERIAPWIEITVRNDPQVENTLAALLKRIDGERQCKDHSRS